MSMPLIDPLPPAPTPADPEDVFDEKAYETVAALAPFVEQTNVLALAVEAEAARSESEADRSQAQVNVATTEANRAQVEAERAKDEADRAEQARDDAVVVVTDGQGSLTPAPGKFPVAGSTGTIKQDWIENLQFELDALRVVRNKLMYGEGPYPVLDLQFQGAKYLDPRITFTRASADWDEEGNEYGVDEPVLTDQGLWVSGVRTNLFSRGSIPEMWTKGNTTFEGKSVYKGRTLGTFLRGEGAGSGYVDGSLGYVVDKPFSAQVVVRLIEQEYLFIYTYSGSSEVLLGFRLRPDGSTYGLTGIQASTAKYYVKALGDGVFHIRFEGLTPEEGTTATRLRVTCPATEIGFDAGEIQIEEGATCTPYIPTNGSQVTVAPTTVEVKNDAFYSFFNPEAGTLTLDTGENNLVNTGGVPPFANFGILGSSAATITGGLVFADSVYFLRGANGEMAISNVRLPKILRGNPNFSLAVVYDSTNTMAAVDGMTSTGAEGDVAGFMQNSASRIYLDPFLNGYAKSITYYDKKLTEEQLQEITS